MLLFVQQHKIQRVWSHIIHMFWCSKYTCPTLADRQSYWRREFKEWLDDDRQQETWPYAKIRLSSPRHETLTSRSALHVSHLYVRCYGRCIQEAAFNPTWYFILDCRVLAHQLTEVWVLELQTTETVWYVRSAAQCLLLKSCFCSLQTGEVMRGELPEASSPQPQTPQRAGSSHERCHRASCLGSQCFDQDVFVPQSSL